ncbi:MAG: hypothetical protein JNL38_32580 [Myxococcales bacterium]|jgi:hypothetical protein|nr:hypothetical protein [Myxococcales bacterium]
MKVARLIVSLVGVACLAVGCGNSDEPYKAAPAWSGRKPALPPVPALKSSPIKIGDAYTVHGAIHHLRSRLHDKEVTAKDISIQGYIVDSNIPNAPECAIHKAGQKDKDDCKSEIPSFWIADSKTPGKDDPKIRVLGFAKNFASVFEAMNKYKGLKEPPKELYKDEIWSVDVPYPLPAVGAKVKITGHYGYTFGKSSTGIVSDPVHGVATYGKIEVLEPAPEPAAFKNKKI